MRRVSLGSIVVDDQRMAKLRGTVAANAQCSDEEVLHALAIAGIIHAEVDPTSYVADVARGILAAGEEGRSG